MSQAYPGQITMAKNHTVANKLQKLQLVGKLLDGLHSGMFTYCHWKSSEHLDASMLGDTDLDILFDVKQKSELAAFLRTIGFRKFVAPRFKTYKDIEDYVGLDYETGKIVHVHAHFRLTLGESYLKSYQLHWENEILSTRYFNDDFGIYCIKPEYELLLLLFRQSLKMRMRDVLKWYVNQDSKFSIFFQQEYDWLVERCSYASVTATKMPHFPNPDLVHRFLFKDFNKGAAIKLKEVLSKELRGSRVYPAWKVNLLRWSREALIKFQKAKAKFKLHLGVAKRVDEKGGLVVAVIGADGSGKSTVSNDLVKNFQTKIDVRRIYFGRGDGKISILRKLLYKIKGVKDHGEAKLKSSKEALGGEKVTQRGIADWYRCIHAMIIAYEKKSRMKDLITARSKGIVIVCDRYPQTQIYGYNDGPLLYHLTNARGFFFRCLARLEYRIYKSLENESPDLVIRLVADASIVEARKPGETNLDVLRKKIDGVKQLHFKKETKVVTINAEQPLSDVLAEVRKEVWRAFPE